MHYTDPESINKPWTVVQPRDKAESLRRGNRRGAQSRRVKAMLARIKTTKKQAL